MDHARLRFEQYLKRRFGQSTTLKCYTSDLNIFVRAIGNKAPKAVTAGDVDAFIDGQIAAGLSPTSINRRLASLRAFFEYLAGEQPERDWPNPVVWQRHRLKTGTRLPRDLADSEVARLFAGIADARDRAMFGLMVGAGLRVGEVAALRLEDVEMPTPTGRLAILRVRGKADRQRMVWLVAALWETLSAWLQVRQPTETDRLFINQWGRAISVSGIQYRLKEHARTAGVTLTCHQLRHTFARRLVESGLPVDSLARLLGHSQLHTTQRYIDGADPTLRSDFADAMVRLQSRLSNDEEALPPARPSPGHRQRPRRAPQTDLLILRESLLAAGLPPWLSDAMEAYLRWRWPTWRVETARQLGRNFISAIRRVWAWLAEHRQVQSWETLRRPDLQAWLQARCEDGVSAITIQNELCRMRGLLKFVEARGCQVDPGLFRVQAPRKSSLALPRYLPEGDYRRLETAILCATEGASSKAYLDRAWFLTLAHTGVRISELLSLRLDDVDLAGGRAIVRGGKPGRDRVVYLTPPLIEALRRYVAQRPDLPDEDRLFVLRGRLPSARAIQRRLARYGQQAGVQVTPHRLRHTLATRLINQGMPIHSLRKLLGHQHLSTTQIYARIYDQTLYEQFRAAMARLEAIAVEDWPHFDTMEHRSQAKTMTVRGR